MAQQGTTRKQLENAMAQLKSAGFKAWPTARGNHYLWVVAPCFDDGSGVISVPKVSAFIEQQKAPA